LFNIRNPIGLSCAEVERRVREVAGKFAGQTPGLTKVEVKSERGAREPIYVDPERFPEWIGPMREAYTAVTGRPTALETIGGTTFAKAFPNAVCFGPVDQNEEEELAHQVDERVTLAALRRNIEIYGRAIIGIAS
jgi:succinyl-diaminopimelate desuccinylase